MALKQDVSPKFIFQSFIYWTLSFFRLVTWLVAANLLLVLSIIQVKMNVFNIGVIITLICYAIALFLIMKGECLQKKITYSQYFFKENTIGEKIKTIVVSVLCIAAFLWLFYFATKFFMSQAGLYENMHSLPFGKYLGICVSYVLVGGLNFIGTVFVVTGGRDMGEVVLREEFGINDELVIYKSGYHYEAEIIGENVYVEKKNDYDEYGGKKASWLGFFLPIIGFPCWVVVTIIRFVRNRKTKVK